MENWHSHEAKIEIALADYFEKKGYYVALHRASDIFDMILAKVSNNKVEELIGIEIKSDNDNLRRLYEQLPNYLYVFDKVYIALGNRKIIEDIPYPIGLIRVNGEIIVEREAYTINFMPSRFITKSAIRETIEKSKGIKSRADELLVYLDGIEQVKRKLIYNTLFYDRKIQFTLEEDIIVEFIINNKHSNLKQIGLFSYDIGEIYIGVENGT